MRVRCVQDGDCDGEFRMQFWVLGSFTARPRALLLWGGGGALLTAMAATLLWAITKLSWFVRDP